MILLAALLAAVQPAASPAVTAEAGQCGNMDGAGQKVCQALNAQKAGRFAEAASAFESAALLQKPGDTAADRMLAAAGNMWIAAGQPGKAAVALDKALTGTGLLADQRGEALLDRARAAEAQGDLKTARAKVTAASVTIGGDAFLWYFSAALAIRENDAVTAKAAIGRALTLEPNNSTVLFEAGHVYHFAGETEAARGYWSRASAADPGGKSGQAARDALKLLPAPTSAPIGR